MGMRDLASLLYLGENVTQDYRRAFELFKKSESDPISQEYLGLCYFFGHGCKKDTNLAKKYFVSAVHNGNDNARVYLTPQMDLKPYAAWDLKEQGARVLGGAAAFFLGSLLSSIGGDE
jgi:TPR repeat protein